MSLSRQQAYDEAVAVFGPKVRFVEWKMYEVDSEKPPYYPFALKGTKTWDTWAEIEGARWIYAFRRPQSDAQQDARNTAPAVLVDELYLDEHGKLYGVDMDKVFSGDTIVERDRRPDRVAIGDTVSFVRQLFGVNFDYWFFGARIRLPSKTLKKIMAAIPLWTSRTHFWPGDQNIVWGGQDDVPKVPILDPITVARYLHAYYVSAANDVIKYLTPIDDPDDRDSKEKQEKTIERQKKLRIAQIVDALLDADKGDLGTGSKVSVANQAKLVDFLEGYTNQLQFRTDWRDRWAKYLANWLGSEVIALVADAHLQDAKNDFGVFFVNMALCHSRLSETKVGRDLLAAHFSDAEQYSWVRKFVLGRDGGVSDNLLQMIRKYGSAPLEFIKEHVPVWMAQKPTMTAAEEINAQIERAFGLDHKVVQVFKTGSGEDLYMAWVKKGGKEELEFEEIDVAEIIERHSELHLTPAWKGAVNSLAAGIELINFALKLRAFEEAYQGDKLKAKVIAFTELVGAGLDLTSAGMTLLKVGSKRTLAVLGFASGVIDAVLAGIEVKEAIGEGNIGKAIGAGVVGAGSLVVAAGFLLEADLVPGGIFIVGIGYMLKAMFPDDNDYQRFVAHSAFGDELGRGEEKPEWYEAEKTFAEWADDLDEQIHAAVMLLCKFELEPDIDDAPARKNDASIAVGLLLANGTDQDLKTAIDRGNQELRSFKLKMRWLPAGAKLQFACFEVWKNPSDNRSFQGTIVFTEEAPRINSIDMTVDAKDVKEIGVSPHGKRKSVFHPSLTRLRIFSEELLSIAVSAWLTVKMNGKEYEVRAKDTVLYDPKW